MVCPWPVRFFARPGLTSGSVARVAHNSLRLCGRDWDGTMDDTTPRTSAFPTAYVAEPEGRDWLRRPGTSAELDGEAQAYNAATLIRLLTGSFVIPFRSDPLPR